MEGGERVRDRCVGLEGWMGCAHGGWGARAAHPSSISACSCPSVDDREEAGDVDPCSTGSQQKLEPGSALDLQNLAMQGRVFSQMEQLARLVVALPALGLGHASASRGVGGPRGLSK